MALLRDIPYIMKHFSDLHMSDLCVCLRTRLPDAIEVGVDETLGSLWMTVWSKKLLQTGAFLVYVSELVM